MYGDALTLDQEIQLMRGARTSVRAVDRLDTISFNLIGPDLDLETLVQIAGPLAPAR